MDSFFSELKSAREAKGISLGEISDATLINLKMLEALERGEVSVVPQAYIRAFIREYAHVVGLDDNETMKKYNAWLKSKEVAATELQPKPKPVEVQAAKKKETRRDKFQRLVPTFFKIGLAIVVLVLVDIVLWSVLEKEPTQPVKETPFREVVKENEDRAGSTETQAKRDILAPSTQTGQATTIDSPKTKRPATAIPSIVLDKDSLTLVATTTDSVWLQIVVDDDRLTEHYLLPKTTFIWKAKNEFWISAIGNPGAITLTLNNKPVTVPVRRGFVTRDLRLTRESLINN
ncbi:MAG: RodZ domain-containing protein [Bacteroidota bacterium]